VQQVPGRLRSKDLNRSLLSIDCRLIRSVWLAVSSHPRGEVANLAGKGCILELVQLGARVLRLRGVDD